jgi:F0F1-type ATP synthase membrane subunit b/b'
MEMLKSLGIDFTIIIQFFIFLTGYIILTKLVFKPYFNAYLERYNRTEGSEDKATQIIEETEELEKEYEENAKALNYKIKKIFDDEKKSSITAQDEIIKEAQLKSAELRSNSERQLEETKNKILDELNAEIKPLSDLIKQTVIG